MENISKPSFVPPSVERVTRAWNEEVLKSSLEYALGTLAAAVVASGAAEQAHSTESAPSISIEPGNENPQQ